MCIMQGDGKQRQSVFFLEVDAISWRIDFLLNGILMAYFSYEQFPSWVYKYPINDPIQAA